MHKQTGDKRKAVNTSQSTPNPYADKSAPTSPVPRSLWTFALFSEVCSFMYVCTCACMHACTHIRVATCPSQKQQAITSTNARQECKEKAAVQRPDSTSPWITNPSREKQTDRKHEMDGEECKGKRVLFPGFSKKAALPSEKQKAQIRTGENRGGQLMQRTCAPSNRAKKRDATAAEPHFPPA